MHIDESQFPLLMLSFQGAVTDEELSTLIRRAEEFANRAARLRRHYAVVSVGEGNFTATQRLQIAKWIAAMPSEREVWDLGNYVVVPSAVARNTLTAISWVSPRLRNVHVFESRDEAVAAARAKLRETEPPEPLLWSRPPPK